MSDKNCENCNAECYFWNPRKHKECLANNHKFWEPIEEGTHER